MACAFRDSKALCGGVHSHDDAEYSFTGTAHLKESDELATARSGVAGMWVGVTVRHPTVQVLSASSLGPRAV